MNKKFIFDSIVYIVVGVFMMFIFFREEVMNNPLLILGVMIGVFLLLFYFKKD